MFILIDNYDSFTWNLWHFLSDLGAEVEIMRNDAATPDEVLSRARGHLRRGRYVLDRVVRVLLQLEGRLVRELVHHHAAHLLYRARAVDQVEGEGLLERLVGAHRAVDEQLVPVLGGLDGQVRLAHLHQLAVARVLHALVVLDRLAAAAELPLELDPSLDLFSVALAHFPGAFVKVAAAQQRHLQL